MIQKGFSGVFSGKTPVLIAASILLLAVSGLTARDPSVTWITPMVLGTGLWVLVAAGRGFFRSSTAWLTLLSMNLSFWLGWGLWRARDWVVPAKEFGGIDPYAGPMAIWVLLLFVVGVYALAVFGWTLVVSKAERASAAAGLIAVTVQSATSLYYAWSLVEGV